MGTTEYNFTSVMKRSWMAFLVVAVATLVACNKEGAFKKIKMPLGGGKAQAGRGDLLAASVYASEWQTLDRWDRSDKGFKAQSMLPVKPEGGKVLLFARNVWALDAPMEEPMEDIPLQLPFAFLPYTDQPGLTETWQYDIKGNEVEINLQVSGTETAPKPRTVQVRSVYISDSMWANLRKAGMAEQDLAYEDLVSRLGINP